MGLKLAYMSTQTQLIHGLHMDVLKTVDKAREKKHELIIPARVINARRMHIIFYFLISFYPPFCYETCRIFLSYLINST